MTKWTERELGVKIKEVREDLFGKRRYLKLAQLEVERLQIVLERYEDELAKLKMNPSSRSMS